MNSQELSEVYINEDLLQQAFEFSASNPRKFPKSINLHASAQLVFQGTIDLRLSRSRTNNKHCLVNSIEVSVTTDNSGNLRVLGCREFLKSKASSRYHTLKRRKLVKEQVPALAVIPASKVKHQVDDAALCSALRNQDMPLALADGPWLNFHENGAITLSYSTAIVPDQKVMLARQHPVALQFLSRVCQDPSLIRPDQFELSAWDLLNYITRPGSSSEDVKIHVEDLKTELLRYQRESLKWCLRREGMDVDENGKLIALTDEVRYSVISPALGWRKVLNTDIWVNPYLLRSSFGRPKPVALSKNIAFEGKGLLAEEMGLGKTLEMIALSLMNPRPENIYFSRLVPSQVDGRKRSLLPSKATLVIVPKTILLQWVSEVQLHAPHLKSLVVSSPSHSVAELVSADFVFVTYSQLSRWLPLSTEKRKRKARQNRYSFLDLETGSRLKVEQEVNHSTLIDVEFWRTVLDEVQMVNSGVSAAAQVARRIPRVHAWAASGTPVRHSLKDLRGILSFLNLHPFTEAPCWKRFISSSTDFNSTMKLHAIRHTKATVKDQLLIPKQHRRLILLNFSEIETARYNKLQREFLDDEVHPNCNLANWLLRLRQACSHAAAQSNYGGDVFALSMDQVLSQLLEESELEVWTQQRERFLLQLQLGQLYDLAYNMPLAFKEWDSVMESLFKTIQEEDIRSAGLVRDAESAQAAVERLEAQIKKGRTIGIELDVSLKDESNLTFNRDDWHAQQLKDEGFLFDARRSLFLANGRVKSSRARCRSLRELLHRTYFFLGTGYFRSTQRLKLKLSAEELSLTDVQEMIKTNHDQEINFYGLAEQLRGQILGESAQRVEDLKKKLKAQIIIKVSAICSIPKAKIADDLATFASELFELLHDILTQPLIEDFSSTKPTGTQVNNEGLNEENDAYAKTLDLQELAHIYLEMLQVILRDRAAAISGGNIQPTPQIAFLEEAGQNLVGKLVDRRDEIVGLLQHDRTPLISWLKKLEVEEDKIDLIKQEIRGAQNYYSSLQDLYNHRIEFYKQLQVLSDQVSDLDTGSRTDYDALILHKIGEIKLVERQTMMKQRNQKYLRDLEQSERNRADEDKKVDRQGSHANVQKCAICLDEILRGVMTPCAHYFCIKCLEKWLPIRRTCPLCNRQMNQDQVYRLWSNKENIEVLKRDLGPNIPSFLDQDEAAGFAKAKEHFIPISDMLRSQIGEQQIVREYGVKIDTIVRHAMYLRSQDSLSQIVVFSQWGNMLKVLKTAFAENKVSTASINDPVDNVNKFRADPNVACLLLQAKVDVAGLTLVNANNVFLCEPLLNTALEWQAVSRINRIGQMRETTVWQFCVEGTVERAILASTTNSRLMRSMADGGDHDDDHFNENFCSQGLYLTPDLVDKRSGSELVGDSESLRRLLPKADGARVGAITTCSNVGRSKILEN